MKIKVTNSKTIIVETISILLIILFVYAALNKLLDFQNFQVQLGQSPLVSSYTNVISYSVLTVEFVIALMLAIPKTRFWGLLSSFTLMVTFTAYIIVVLNYASFVPCSCGGILEELGWKEHLIFNSVFTFLAACAVWMVALNRNKALLKLLVIAIASAAVVVILYLKSEDTMHRENPFIRRFIQGTAYKTGETELNSYSKYFAGSNGNTIYLGDTQSPLNIVAFDTTLKIKHHHKIELDKEDFPFSAVQVRVAPPYFYLMDGTVPVIYRGNISDWKAKLLMYNNNYYFSKAEIIAENKIVFRAQELQTMYNILGTFTFLDSLQIDYAPQLLQKQIDGFFDTDGMMLFDRDSQTFVYTYYYRNQFIVADQNLNLSYRGNTIDTTSMAKLKIVQIKETGQRKIANIPSTVNQITATSNGLLFINSKIIGKYEPKEMWKKTAIVDVYNVENNTYICSMYIYDVNKSKLQAMYVYHNKLYAIIGNNLHKYNLSNHIVGASNEFKIYTDQ